MGLFGKKKVNETQEGSSSTAAEPTLKSDLEIEIEGLEAKVGEKQKELDDTIQRITTVKEEYDLTVSNLMLVKKELNQKKMELDIIQREYKDTRERNKKAEFIKDTKDIETFKKTKGEHSKISEELDEFSKKHDKIKEEIVQEQTTLHNIKKQQAQVEKELDEANARLYNAKEELDKKDTFEDTDILTPSEKKIIGVDKTDKKSSAGVIEAASVIVGSLKSKLNTAQKELDAMQTLLIKERDEHAETKQELNDLKQDMQSIK